MPLFKYKIRRKDGQENEGEMESSSRLELARSLRAEGNLILSVKEIKKGEGKGNILNHVTAALNRVGLKDKIIFAGNLSAMISAGLTLSRSLSVMQRQTKNPKLKEIINNISKSVRKGKSFEESLKDYSKIFPPIFIAMVHVGEESGNLPGSLKIVSEQMEKTYSLHKKIKSAMIYPSIVVIVIAIIGTLMMIYMVPTLSATFKELGAELPVQTRFIIGISDFLVNNISIVLIGFVVLALSFYKFFSTKIGKKVFAFMLLRLPITKTITIKSNSALTMRTLSSLITSGIGLVRGLEITADVLQNYYYSTVILSAQKNVQNGETLTSIFNKHKNLFPPFVSEMIQVGEETGKLGEMLLKGAEFYEEEVDSITKNLSTIIEPLLMVFIGAAVGFFAIAMIQPMYSLGDYL